MKNLLPILLLLNLAAYSQTLDCQLKPPAVTVHFGAGSVNDVNTASLANYGRVGSSCPSDGHYTFTSATSDCFRGDWHTLSEDHTLGDAGGNMMLVNASYEGGAFLTTTVKGLKANTIYEFGVWMMNVCKPSDKCPFPLLPKIVIRLQSSSGKTVAQFGTGEITRQTSPNWKQYRARFTMPASAEPLTLTMVNNSPGGCGNDFALDDLTFRECVKIPPITPPTTKAKVIANPPTVKKPVVKKTTPTTQVKKQPKIIPAVRRQTDSLTPKVAVVTRKITSLPSPPPALRNRSNPTVKEFQTESGEIKLDLYDNGEIDGDTVSIYHNNALVVAHAKLSQKPITMRIAIDASNPHHELVMVAENLGSIPPNTSLMIVTAGSKRYQVFITSTEQKNSKVVFDLKE